MNVTPKQLCDDLIKLLDSMKLGYQKLAEEHDLTKTQLFALFSIDAHGELAMGHMAGALHCDASNVTGIVDRLVSQELIIRKEHPTDRRTKILQLTPKGHEVMTAIKASLPEYLGCNKLNAEERGQLQVLVRKMQ